MTASLTPGRALRSAGAGRSHRSPVGLPGAVAAQPALLGARRCRGSSPSAARAGTGWCRAACTRPRRAAPICWTRSCATARATASRWWRCRCAPATSALFRSRGLPRRRLRLDLRARAGALHVRGDEADEAAQPDQAGARRRRHGRRAGPGPRLPAGPVAAPRRDQPRLADDQGRPRAGSAGRRDGRAGRSGPPACSSRSIAQEQPLGLHHLRPGVGRAAGRAARSHPPRAGRARGRDGADQRHRARPLPGGGDPASCTSASRRSWSAWAAPRSSAPDHWLVPRLVRFIGRWGRAIYPARTQLQYKQKWAPEIVETEYIAFQKVSLGALFALLIATRSLVLALARRRALPAPEAP